MTSDGRQLVKALAGERPRAAYRTCGYCGRACRGKACAEHRDLPQLEHALTETNEPTRETSEVARAGSSTKGD